MSKFVHATTEHLQILVIKSKRCLGKRIFLCACSDASNGKMKKKRKKKRKQQQQQK